MAEPTKNNAQNNGQNNDPVVVVGGARTPFARERTVYKNMTAAALGGIAIREAVSRSGVSPKLIQEVYFGIVSAPPEGTNVAREALFDSGLDPHIPCTTINRYCASSAEAVAGIVAKIEAGQIECGVAGGVESISSIQVNFSKKATDYFYRLSRAKTLGDRLKLLTQISPKFFTPIAPGIKEPTTGLSMGQSADLMAREFKIGRKEQDEYAVESHQKAAKAWETGFYKTHVALVQGSDGKMVERDTDIRPDTSVEKLAKLRPVFYPDGTITAGNASPLTDGASAVVLMKESKAKALGLTILGAIRSVQSSAVDIQKEALLIGPVFAIPKALEKAGITWEQVDLFEIHEAFAAQVLSTFKAIESDEFAQKKLGLPKAIGKVDRRKVNPHGGSVPLGHPFGATGTRMVLQAMHGLKTLNKKYALISICAAGGLGTVLVVENRD